MLRTVLIVEDEWAIADWLELMLSEQAFNVLTASNGREALNVMLSETPDLVLTDFMMPQLDGAGLVAAMQADDRLRHIPVIVMTSIIEASVRERIRHFHAYLRKPFRETDLINAVRTVLPK